MRSSYFISPKHYSKVCDIAAEAVVQLYTNTNELYYSDVFSHIINNKLHVMGWVSSNAHFSLDEIKNFILELCEIVKYLHSLEIYALDLKPDHIRNNNNKIFLIDWYEKSYGAQWGDPYRLFTNGEPSKSEDIYAIGNLIYFYLTGKHPFSSNNPLQSLYMMRKSKPQLTYTIFDDIIGRCLSKNPRDRYSDIGELIKGIKEA